MSQTKKTVDLGQSFPTNGVCMEREGEEGGEDGRGCPGERVIKAGREAECSQSRPEEWVFAE